ncbi:MAG: hypothetical protein WAU47_03105 [Desulfobaccales bacterium]
MAAGPANAVTEYGPVQSNSGHWYQAVYVSEGISWMAAQSDASSKGGYLATITSEGENTFASDLVTDAKYWVFSIHNHGPYLGGIDKGVSPSYNDWTWVNDDTWNYTNWGSGQPDTPGTELYLQFFNKDSSLPGSSWNDIMDSWNGGMRGYIIEYDTNPVPLPPGVLLLGSGLLGLLGWGRFRQQ